MKILIITQYFYPETFRVNTLCAELVRRGHEVTVLTGYPQYPQGKIYPGYGYRKEYQKYWEGARIERIQMRPRGKTPMGLFLNCWSFVHEGNKWVKACKIKYDAVYVFEVSPVTVGLPAVTYKKKFRTPIFFNVQDLWPESVEAVLGIHNRLIMKFINSIVDHIYNASDKILCSSSSFVKNIASRGVDQNKLLYWPQFCDEPNFDGMEKPEIYSHEFFNIVFAGNLGDAQGLDLLVEAANQLKNTKARWYLVGDGRAKERLQNLVKKLGLDNIVHFIGKVSEPEANRYIHYADCAYLSFQNNKLFDMVIPAKLQSYMACGTPILAAVSGESAEVIQEAQCGFVCERDAKRLSNLIRNEIFNSDKLEIMRTNAKTFYDQHFKPNILIDELEKMMYESFND